MELYHDGLRLGTLTRHFYETPWASAWLIAGDPTIIPRYAAICAFHAWCEQLPDDLPDARPTHATSRSWPPAASTRPSSTPTGGPGLW